jgi:hypothetical protein
MPRAAAAEALVKLCPDLESWPQRWRYEQSDIAPGERIVECFRPFLLGLLEQGLARKTLQRHRDHLWMLGGEIIRRLHEDPALKRKSIQTLVLDLIDNECGPLIWPRITEQQQNSFDATCRKLYQFLTTSPKPAAQ